MHCCCHFCCRRCCRRCCHRCCRRCCRRCCCYCVCHGYCCFCWCFNVTECGMKRINYVISSLFCYTCGFKNCQLKNMVFKSHQQSRKSNFLLSTTTKWDKQTFTPPKITVFWWLCRTININFKQNRNSDLSSCYKEILSCIWFFKIHQIKSLSLIVVM